MQAPEVEPNDVERHVLQVVARVRSALSPQFGDDEIEERVRQTFANWDEATVRDFIPLLAERRVLESLRR